MKRPWRHRVVSGLVIAAVSALLGLATTIVVARPTEVPKLGPGAMMHVGRVPGEQRSLVTCHRTWKMSFYIAEMVIADVRRYESLSTGQWQSLVGSVELSEKVEPFKPPSVFRGGEVPEANAVRVLMVTRGWPLRSFYWLSASALLDKGGTLSRVSSTDSGPMLPLAPGKELWWPLAVNTLFFAAPWMVLLPLTGLSISAARRVRRNRGYCPRCNYDRTGIPANAPCPECGMRPPSTHA